MQDISKCRQNWLLSKTLNKDNLRALGERWHFQRRLHNSVKDSEYTSNFRRDLFKPDFYRSSRTEVLLGKNILKICSKFTVEQPCRKVVSIKLQNSFIEITLWHGCSSVNLVHIFRTPFLKNTFGRLP